MSKPDAKRTLEFPASPKPMDRSFTWDEVRQYVDAENMERAEYVARLLIAFSERYGDEVYDLARQVIYNIGYERGQKHAATVKEKSFEHVMKLFSDPAMANYFGFEPKWSKDKVVAQVHYCPLPRQWKQMGMTDDEIIRLCSIFDEAEQGLFEGYSERFTEESTGCATLSEKGYCQMTMGAIPRK
jgi:predicted hydrocarbon binding protein